MKRIIGLVALLLLVACSPRLGSPEDLGKALYKSLRAGNGRRFAACCLNTADIKFLNTKVRVSNPENPPEYKPLSDLAPELPEANARLYNGIREALAAEKLDWRAAVLDSVQVGQEVQADWVPKGVRMMDSLTLHLSCGGEAFELRFYDIVHTQRGWVVGNPLYRLQRAGE